MEILEEHDRFDYDVLVSKAVGELFRIVAKTPVAPMFTVNNPKRRNLTRALRKSAKLANISGKDVTVYVTITTKDLFVSTSLPNGGSIYQYEVLFTKDSFRVKHASSCYEG